MKKLLLIFFLLSCLIIKATTYHISPTGNDATGTGSISTPWLTLYKATSTALTFGDIIYVHAGTFIETQQAVLAVGVSIDGDGVTSIIKSTLTTNQVEIINARSNTEGTNGFQYIRNLKFDGQMTTAWAIAVFARSNVAIYNCTFIDFYDSGILFVGKTTFVSAAPTIYARGNSFYNNRTYNCSRFGNNDGEPIGSQFGRGHLWAIGQDSMIIRDNYMNQTQRPLGQNGWLIKCLDYTKQMQIYNDSLVKIPFHGDYAGDRGWDFAIEMADNEACHIHHNDIKGGAIDLNRQTKGIYAYSAWVHDNHIYHDTLNDNYESAIVFEYQTDVAIIENNKVEKMSAFIQFNTRQGDDINDVTIRNNLAVDMGREGIDGNNGVFVFIGSEGSPLNDYTVNRFKVVNNTFVSKIGSRVNYGFQLGNLAIGFEKNIEINNNIIMNASNHWLSCNSAIAFDSLHIKNNMLYNNASANAEEYAGATPTPIFKSGNLNTDPLFVNPAAGDYTLQSGSPAKNSGTDGTDRGYTGGGGTPPTPVIFKMKKRLKKG